MEAITATDVASDADAVPIGAADVHNRQLRALQSTDGPTENMDMAEKNAHTLLTDTRRRRPSNT